MKIFESLRSCFALLCLNSVVFFSFVQIAPAATISKKQVGNTISGYVFGAERQPVSDTSVELTDDFFRTVGRVQTNSSGRYIFNNVSQGKYRVKVLPYATNYEEQIQEVEITNYLRQSSSGSTIRSGIENSQCDFYLKPKKGSGLSGVNGVVFLQEIPKSAKSKYDEGVANLGLKKTQEGLSSIKSAIEIFPDYFDALALLGNEYVKLKYYDAARAILTKATEVNSKSYASWYGLAYSNYSLNQIDESSIAVNKAIILNPSSLDAIMLNGILLKQGKKYDASLEQLKKAKELAKGSVPEINWQLALLYANNFKLYNKAAEELELFLKEQPDSKDSETIKKLIAQFKEKAKN